MDHSDHHSHHDHAAMGHGVMNLSTTSSSPIVDTHAHHHLSTSSSPIVDAHAHHHGANHGMGMDMDMCGDGGHSHGMMSMSFHFGYCETVLFSGWHISTPGGLVGSIFGIFLMAVLYEGLKYYREHLFWKTYHGVQYAPVSTPPERNEEPRVLHVVGEVIHKQPPTCFSMIHFYQTLLHIIQVVLSYFLMLIFMTYNVWLCVAVTLGAATGYFLFGWRKSVIVDVTDHCH